MKKKYLLVITTLLMLFTASLSMTAFVGCGERKKPVVVHIAEEVTGTYYVDENGVENTIDLQLDSFTLNFGGSEKIGAYSSFDNSSENNVLIGFKFNKSSDTMSAAYSKGVIVLTYNGKMYRMLRKVNYTVAFDVDGGSAVVAQEIKNGKTATQPQNPTKAGCAFIGWYTDTTYANKFDFSSTVISANVTVYARFIEIDPAYDVYTAQFDLGYEGGEELDSVNTINGQLYNLPVPAREGYEFVGWWMSDYYTAEKLSRKYIGQTLKEDVTLYAVWASEYPAVSVSANGADWTVKGESRRYTVVIKNAEGTELKRESGEKTSVEFDFGSYPEGDYTVEVTCDGKTTIAYYLNKPLARVTEMNVEANVFKFTGVEGAERYLLTVNCGNPTHNHTDYDLGSTTEYDFSACEMKDGKITFVVKAAAEGRATSTSEEYVLDRYLEGVTGLTVDAENETVKWNATANADAYLLQLTDGQNTVEETLTATEYSMNAYAPGQWTVKVKPLNKLYNSPEYAVYNYTKVRLACPTEIYATQTSINWNEIAGATGYIVLIDGTEYTVSTNSFELTEEIYAGGEFTVKVKAIGATQEQNSLYSDELQVYGSLSEVTYGNGMVAWSPVIGVVKYGVALDGGTEQYSTDGSCKLPAAFTSAGEHVITVNCYSVDGNVLDSKDITVQVYAVEFDSNGGTRVPTLYNVEGDTITLPEGPARAGYDFIGWFNNPTGGTRYEDSIVLGAGAPAIYACWNAKEYTVTLVVGDGGSMEGETEIKVVYGSNYTLPVPNCNNEEKAFGGWYSLATGGVRYTDDGGNSRFAWDNAKDTTLYAQWSWAGVSYELNTDGTYLVKKGKGINYLTTVTILDTYNGKPVTQIVSNAFEGCATLKTIRIPSSLRSVFLPEVDENGNGGPTINGSAFFNCNALEAIEVYDVPGEKFYASYDGCLYTIKNGSLDALVFVPKGLNKPGATITIAEGTKTINGRIMSSFNEVTGVIIPSSVTYIGPSAFVSCYELSNIVFLPTADGSMGEPLTIEDSFKYSKALTTVTLPKRLVSLDLSAFDSSYIDLKGIYIQELGEEKDKNTNYYDIDGVLCKGSAIIYAPKGLSGEYRIPSGIYEIADEAFKGCEELTFVGIPGYVTKIGASAFSGCSGIKRITFDQGEDNSDLTIGEKAFYGCDITELILPPALVHLGANAFGNILTLDTVTMNMSRENLIIENGAFMASSTSTSSVRTLNIGPNVVSFDISGTVGNTISKVNVDPANPNYTAEDNILYDKAQTKILFIPMGKTDFVLPSTLKEIGGGLFKGIPITSIAFGSGIELIGESAFEGCEFLTSVTFAQGGTSKLVIEKAAFKNCSVLETLVLPLREEAGSVIGESAFEGCKSLVTLDVPEGFTTIDRWAFKINMGNLTTVNLPASIETLGKYQDDDKFAFYTDKIKVKIPNTNIFDNCATITAINVAEGGKFYGSVDGVLYGKDTDGNYDTLYLVPSLCTAGTNANGESGYLVVPETVTKVADFAFYFVRNVKDVTFAGEHTSFDIGVDAFKSASGLQRITLPSGITELPENLFYLCSGLLEVEVPNTVTSIKEKAFASCNALKRIVFAEGGDAELVIADGKKPSGQYTTITGVFVGCYSLEEVIFTDRLKSLGNYAFAADSLNKNALKKVVIPTSTTKIGEGAFYNDKHLTTVEFVDAGNKAAAEMVIGRMAFQGTAINSIDLPDNVVEIMSNAFTGAPLKELSIPASVKTLGIISNPSIESIVIETAVVDGVEKSALTTISSNVFANLKAVKSIDLSATSITAIPNDAFKNSTALTSVALPSTVTSIGASAFLNCASLTSFNIPLSITSIGASAFSDCTSLTSLTFTKDENGKTNIEEIGNYVVKNTALTRFDFPETTASALTIGSYLFEKCNKLTTVYISLAVNADSIGIALAKAPAITTFELAESSTISFNVDKKLILSVASVDDGTYKLISAFDSVPTVEGRFEIPSNIVEIGENAFAGQNGIKTLVIPTSVEIIGNKAFENCRALTDIVFSGDEQTPSNLRSIGDNAFAYTYMLGNVVLPDSVKEIGTNCFYASGIKSITFPDVLTKVGKTIFYYCFWLESADNISKMTLDTTYTGERMFAECYALKNVTFADGFTTLPKGLFYKSGIESADLTGITEYATVGSDYGIFEECYSLKSVILDESLTKLGYRMFNDCTSLTTISVGKTAPVEGFADLKNITMITKDNTSTSYTIFGGTAIEEIDASSLATNIGYLFSGAAKLKKVILPPAGYSVLGGSMFYNCTSLETVTYKDQDGNLVGEDGCVTLPEGITFLGYKSNGTFQNSGIKKVIIPLSVKTIGTSASSVSASSSVNLFKGCKNLTTVTLHDTMTKFSASIFEGCTSLTTVNYRNSAGVITGKDGEVTLPSSITQFGNKMFYGCESISTVNIESSVKLPNSMFENCTGLTTVSAENVTELGDLVFAGCSSLTNKKPAEGATAALNLAKVTKMGGKVFKNCTSLEYIDLSNVTYISTAGSSSDGFFYNCTNLSEVLFNDKIATLPQGMFSYCISLTQVTLPSSLTCIMNYAFQYSGITSITIPEGVTRIGGTSATSSISATTSTYVFRGCENLKTVTLHDKVLFIGGYAFDGCTNLEAVENASNVTLIAQYAFQNAGRTEKGFTMDLSSVNTLGSKTFMGSGLKEANIANVKTIPADCFNGCKLLNNVDLTGAVTLNSNAFIGCSSLSNVTFGNALTTIGHQALFNCGFDTLIIPASVTSIDTNVFNNHYKVNLAEGNMVYRMDENNILLDADNVVIWVAGTNYSDGTPITSVVYKDGYKLQSYGLNGYSSVTSVTLPSDLTEIPSYAFWNFGGSFGENLTLPEGLTSIGKNAFQNCKQLKNVILPASLESLGTYVFENSSIESVEFKGGLTQISQYDFLNCDNLTSVKLPATLTKIGYYAFQNCTGLTSITFPSNLAEIGNYAFQNCASLASVTFPSALTKIGDYAFKDCTSLSEIKISETTQEGESTSTGVTIGAYAFQNCTAFVGEFELPVGVISLAKYAFEGCTGVTKITLPVGLTSIGAYAFAGLENLTSINIPYTVTTLDDSALAGCTKLSSVMFDETPEGEEEVALKFGNGGTTDKLTTAGYFVQDDELEILVKGLFVGDYALKSINLPSRLTTIGNYAFAYSGIENIIIPEGVETISTGAFMKTAITSITLPASLTSLGNLAFAYCTNLSSVTFADTPEGQEEVALTITGASSSATKSAANTYYNSIDGYYYSGIFTECTALNSITIPGRVKELPKFFFTSSCITSVTLSRGITEIDTDAFGFYHGIKSVTIPLGVTSISMDAFEGWISEQTITIEVLEMDQSTSFSYNAFRDCNANVQFVVVNPDAAQA